MPAWCFQVKSVLQGLRLQNMKMISALLMFGGLLSAQPAQAPNPAQMPNPTMMPAERGASVPIYRITVVARTTKAINYHHRSGSTTIGFRGTALLPEARGEAKVESKQGVIKIDARMQKLEPATRFGPEYLTYVMWAITPEGRATNVGEVLLNGDNSKLDATTELQSFGLIITAEPYFAVTQPSDVVVMENFVTHETTGTIEEIDAKFELLQRGQYTLNVNPSETAFVMLDRRVPLELYEARNAVRIARWTGAKHYASETYEKAVQGLENAEGYLVGRAGKKPIGTVAREAVQMAEDARIITIKKMDEERLSNERQSAADRESLANTQRAAAQTETERVTRDADMARTASQAEAERLKREADAQRAASQADVDRAGREKAEAESARAKSDAEADRLRREGDAQREHAAKEKAEAGAETEKARLALAESDRLREKAEAEKAELRAQLLQQFNLVLETRDTARGLIVTMSDVLFDTGKYSLRPGAREKLAKVSGIILGHPGLRLAVEGHTDNVGGDDYNQKLSEDRGTAVRDYLTHAGIPEISVTTKGFGKTQPVVSNDTAEGRQQNRRVEMVVSGEIIGGQIGSADRAK
jgi:outer membrane protein OmpA-like peptidoglycan-associated protein